MAHIRTIGASNTHPAIKNVEMLCKYDAFQAWLRANQKTPIGQIKWEDGKPLRIDAVLQTADINSWLIDISYAIERTRITEALM